MNALLVRLKALVCALPRGLRWRWALPAAGALLMTGAVLPVVLSSCERQEMAARGRRRNRFERRPLRLGDVPEVRVRLTPRTVRSVRLAATGPYRLFADGRVIVNSVEPMLPVRAAREAGEWRVGAVSATGGGLTLEPAPDTFVRLDGKRFRGRMHLVARGDKGFICVNQLDLESYLAGVLPAEMYPHWHEEALKSQAVAARTFALYHRLRAPDRADYDLGADQSAQMYGGVEAETDRAWRAVRGTHGMVLAVGPPGQEREIFMAQYSACCGGRVNDASAIREAPDLPPLHGGQACDDCRDCPRYRWPEATVSKSDVYQALLDVYPAKARRLGAVKAVRVSRRSPTGWIEWVHVLGRNRDADGKPELLVVRGQDFRLALATNTASAAGVHSANCDIEDRGDAIAFTDGRGWGHGVGLCQWGAQGKAAAGWSAEQILGFYYPGATLIRAYLP